MRKLLTAGSILCLLAACATPPPAARWESESALRLPLATSWPPTVRVTLEGNGAASSTARLMLDTGAEEAALDDRLVEKLHLDRTWLLDSVQGFDPEQGGVGRTTVFQRELNSVRLSATTRLDSLRVIPLPMPATRDGAIGLAAFPGRALALDPVRNEVWFLPRGRVDGLASRLGATSVPVRRDGNLLVAHVVLRGNGGTFENEMVLDTGAGESFLTASAVSAMEGAEPSTGAVTYGVRMGCADAGTHAFRIERTGRFCTLGGDVLLSLGRAIIFDLEGERVVLLPEGYSISSQSVSSERVTPETR